MVGLNECTIFGQHIVWSICLGDMPLYPNFAEIRPAVWISIENTHTYCLLYIRLQSNVN